MGFKVTYAKTTNNGTRKVNEDYLLVRGTDGNARCFFAVADGLGGHGMGDEASKAACEAAMACLLRQETVNDGTFKAVFEECQNALIRKQKEQKAEGQMRTTLNLLCLDSATNLAHWSHVGDSRTYYFKDKKLVRRTFDHSVPQMLVAMGELKEEEIRFHEDRNRLLRVLGVEDHPPVFDVETPVEITGGQQFLLCSDGFWEMISEDQILMCLEDADDPGFWMDNMLELVRRNIGTKKADNYTAVAVWIE